MNGLFTYSEQRALKTVRSAMNGEGRATVVMSRVADDAHITRSTMVNALQKANLAGVIRTRSMGMKGTMIIVTDRVRWEALLDGFDA